MAQLDTPRMRQLTSVPNLISLSRLVAIPFLVFLIINNNWYLAGIFAGFLGFTDFLDGYIARKWNLQTPLGAVLDPLIDRIFIVALLFAFWWAELITVFILSLIIARDLILFFVNFGLNRKLKVEVVYLGIMGTWVIFVAFALILISQPMAPNFLEAFAAAGIIWGVIIYWLAGLEYLKNIWSSKL